MCDNDVTKTFDKFALWIHKYEAKSKAAACCSEQTLI